MVLEDVLFKDNLWKELLIEDKNFVFGLDILDRSGVNAKNGLANAHAYSLLEAREEAGEDGKRVRLVKIRCRKFHEFVSGSSRSVSKG